MEEEEESTWGSRWVTDRLGKGESELPSWSMATNLDVKVAGAGADQGLVGLPLMRFGTLRHVVLAPAEAFAEAPPQTLHPLLGQALLFQVAPGAVLASVLRFLSAQPQKKTKQKTISSQFLPLHTPVTAHSLATTHNRYLVSEYDHIHKWHSFSNRNHENSARL